MTATQSPPLQKGYWTFASRRASTQINQSALKVSILLFGDTLSPDSFSAGTRDAIDVGGTIEEKLDAFRALSLSWTFQGNA